MLDPGPFGGRRSQAAAAEARARELRAHAAQVRQGIDAKQLELISTAAPRGEHHHQPAAVLVDRSAEPARNHAARRGAHHVAAAASGKGRRRHRADHGRRHAASKTSKNSWRTWRRPPRSATCFRCRTRHTERWPRAGRGRGEICDCPLSASFDEKRRVTIPVAGRAAPEHRGVRGRRLAAERPRARR